MIIKHQNFTSAAIVIFLGCVLCACSKVNPNHLAGTSPADFAGKIEGFDSSGQVASGNLVAYWSFDGTEAELKSAANPVSKANDSYVAAGARGQGLKLANGYLYYASIAALNTLKSFTVSEWVQVLNNGSTPTLTFQLTRPGQLFGNINFLLETGWHPASDVKELIVHPSYADVNGGTQDNLNAPWLSSFRSPTIGTGVWTHLVITYDYASNVFQIWANGVMIGATDYQQRGTGYYKPNPASEVIIGGWYNNIPGKQVTSDTWTVPMNGSIDELRVYNTALGSADIKALYELGAAGK